MKIVCISDTHSRHDEVAIPSCDLLLHAGDFTMARKNDHVGELVHTRRFTKWLSELEGVGDIVVIPGNHETGAEKNPDAFRLEFEKVRIIANCPGAKKIEITDGRKEHIFYLDGLDRDTGVRRNAEGRREAPFSLDSIGFSANRHGERFLVYGEPCQPEFCDWGFNVERDEMAKVWSEFEEAVADWRNPDCWLTKEEGDDFPIILLTHGPPYGMGDKLGPRYSSFGDVEADHVGCKHQAEMLRKMFPAVPRDGGGKKCLVVCGHIHSGHGVYEIGDCLVVNASVLNENYNVEYDPVVVELRGGLFYRGE